MFLFPMDGRKGDGSGRHERRRYGRFAVGRSLPDYGRHRGVGHLDTMDGIRTAAKRRKNALAKARKVSADGISANANLKRLYAQRDAYRRNNWQSLAANYEKSVFYQLDLQDAANEFVRFNLDFPDILEKDAAPMMRIHNRMLRGRIMKLQGNQRLQG